MTLFQVVELIRANVFRGKHCFWKVFWKDAAFLAPKGRGNNSCCFCSGMSQTPLETTECKDIYKLLLNLPLCGDFRTWHFYQSMTYLSGRP